MIWKIAKTAAAVIVVAVVIVQVFNAINPTTYDGASLDFDLTEGVVVLTNDTNADMTLPIISDGSRQFRLESSVEDQSGISTLLGTGADRSQLMELSVPTGKSEFSVTRGQDVRVSATDTTGLKAVVYPVTASARQTYVIGAILVTLIGLYYVSHVFEHRWYLLISPKQPQPVATMPTPSTAQGNAARSFGDNRTPKS